MSAGLLACGCWETLVFGGWSEEGSGIEGRVRCGLYGGIGCEDDLGRGRGGGGSVELKAWTVYL